MSRRRASFTGDLFEVPAPASSLPGSMDYRAAVSHLVGEMLRTCGQDRHGIVAVCSRLTGKDVSKAMLDGYTAESRDDFNVPFYLVPALEVACSSYELSSWLAAVRGAQLVIGADAINAELGRLERLRDEATEHIRSLKDQLKRGL